jgi:hypothetical protein
MTTIDAREAVGRPEPERPTTRTQNGVEQAIHWKIQLVDDDRQPLSYEPADGWHGPLDGSRRRRLRAGETFMKLGHRGWPRVYLGLFWRTERVVAVGVAGAAGGSTLSSTADGSETGLLLHSEAGFYAIGTFVVWCQSRGEVARHCAHRRGDVRGPYRTRDHAVAAVTGAGR